VEARFKPHGQSASTLYSESPAGKLSHPSHFHRVKRTGSEKSAALETAGFARLNVCRLMQQITTLRKKPQLVCFTRVLGFDPALLYGCKNGGFFADTTRQRSSLDPVSYLSKPGEAIDMTNLIKTLNLRNGASSGTDPDGDAGSARRLLRLLMSFNAGAPVATAEQLARRAGLPLSSTYRYLTLLREFGLVEERGRSGFYIGPAALRLSQAARAGNPLEQIAQPFLYKLSLASDESVVLLRRVNEKAMCIAGVESAQHIRTPVKIGTQVSIHVGAGPKLLLAMLPEPTRTQILRKCAARYKLDDAQMTELNGELKMIDDRRWAESSGDVFPDVFAVSAPVCDDHDVVASLCVVAPLFRVAGTTASRLRKLVIEAADQISAAVSGHEINAA